ncbi:MAG: hypothetical protein R3F48_12870 [Candidatus Zixiibacteriota bacterium]
MIYPPLTERWGLLIRSIVLYSVVFIPICCCPTIGMASDLNYTISPHWDASDKYLEVQLSFIGEDDGSTIINIPHSWAWQDTYDQGIKDFAILNNDASYSYLPDEYAYEIRHEPSDQIAVQYHVVQYWDDPITVDVYYRPIFRADLFHCIGHAVFAYPDWNLYESLDIELNWENIPPGWKLSNSFGINDEHQNITRNLDDFCHTIFLGGNIQQHRIDISGYPVNIAIYGEWAFDISEFNRQIDKSMHAVRGFWNDYDFPYFLVTLLPTDEPCCSKGGTGLIDSYALFVSQDFPDASGLIKLLTHELFHTWNGRKIRRQAPEELVYWFAEGFTDYYTRLILYRAGLMTLSEYIEDINSTIVDLYQSPARNVINNAILENNHQDKDIEKIPYIRGDLLALRWDTMIINSSAGKYNLDNLMKDLLRAAELDGVVVSADNIDSLIRPYLSSGVSSDIEYFVDSGHTVVIPSDGLGALGILDTVKITPFDLGFVYQKPPEGAPWIISGVDIDGPAYTAGLRDGQILKGRSIYWNNIDKPVELKIIDSNGQAIDISYLPVGKPIPIPQYRLASSATMDSSHK